MQTENNSNPVSLKKATIINATSKYATVILGLLFSAVLSRLLSPEDYGIVAVVTVFTNFFSLFADMGIGTAVIQNKRLSDDDENRIFTFTLYVGIALFVLFSLFSILLVKIYENTVYYVVGPLLGISLALTTFNMVPNARLMKSKKFLLVAIRTILSAVLGYVAAVVIAFLGGKYYAIIFQSIITALITFLWNWKSTNLQFQFHSVINSVKKIWGFSSYQFGFNFVNYFSRNLDNLLTGYFFGNKMLGYYDKAYKLMRYPVDNLTNVITPSIQPILSDYQDDSQYVMEKYNKMAKFLAIIAVYVGCICFFASKEIILLYFGRQWDGAILSFHYLSISLVFQIVGGLSGSIYQCVNKTKQMFWSGIIGSLITVASIMVGIWFGSIEMLSLCYAIGFILNFIKSQWFLGHFCFNESVFKLTAIYIPDAIILAVMSVVLYFVPTLDNLLLSLLLKAGIGFGIYFIMLLLTKEYKTIVSVLPEKLQKKLPRWMRG